MVIDWHNFGFTVLGQSKGEAHPFVRLSRLYERFFAGRADAHFSVTQAMQRWMASNWGVEPVVLYDKAPHFFRETTAAERHGLFARLHDQLASARRALDPERSGASSDGKGRETLFTDAEGNLRPDRPALVVSSTSWTEDEDFGLLLRAIERLDGRIRDMDSFPRVLFVVTGKGPQKRMYEERMSKMTLHKTHVCTMWLEPQDYPLLLGSADLGVCLHTSTSGLDLPMKVVDMFGCGLPVCAVEFDCLHELVRNGENGMVFSFSDELADQMLELLRGATGEGGNAKLKQLRQGVAGFERWQPNWQRNAAPIFYATAARPVWLATCAQLLLVLLTGLVSFVAARAAGRIVLTSLAQGRGWL